MARCPVARAIAPEPLGIYRSQAAAARRWLQLLGLRRSSGGVRSIEFAQRAVEFVGKAAGASLTKGVQVTSGDSQHLHPLRIDAPSKVLRQPLALGIAEPRTK